MPRLRLLAAGAAVLLCGCAGAPPEAPMQAPNGVPVDSKIDSADALYEVHGRTSAEVGDDMREQARKIGETYLAETRWGFKSSFEYSEPAAGGCRMSRITLRTAIRTVLPPWADFDKAAPALQMQWQAFIAAGRVHEKGHYDNAVRAVEEIAAGLRRLTAADTCDALTRAANKVTADVLARIQAIDEKYDAETGHGVRQGALWKAIRPA
jgi:predicted secreted Zn-dependent protease